MALLPRQVQASWTSCRIEGDLNAQKWASEPISAKASPKNDSMGLKFATQSESGYHQESAKFHAHKMADSSVCECVYASSYTHFFWRVYSDKKKYTPTSRNWPGSRAICANSPQKVCVPPYCQIQQNKEFGRLCCYPSSC